MPINYRLLPLLLVVAAMAVGSMLNIQAATLNADDARAIATDFLMQNQSTIRSGNSVVELSLAYTRNADARHHSPLYYVFTDNSHGGWVVVSADDGAIPVLGYSEKGNFDIDALPCNMRAWLDGYCTQLEYLQSHPDASGAPRRDASLNEISPMLSTAWDQTQPFNRQCPKVGNYPTYTGCVATAMAQVMYYHRYPSAECLGIPAYTSKRGINLPALPPTSFDWDQMLPNYYSYNTEQAAAVAQLMRYCGQSVEMDYGTQVSNAVFQTIAFAMNYYFGYSNSATTWMRDASNDADWDQMMYDELAEGRPIIFMGSDASNGGHAFVLDGYRNGMFHINWGWGGNHDSYWQLSALTPNGNNYSTRQYAVLGLARDYADVDGDNEIGISDVSELVDLLLSGTATGRIGDVNNDHVTDISDLSDLIDMLLAGSGQMEVDGESFTVNGVTFRMVKVDGGSFDMGATDEQPEDAYENEYPVHRVILSSYYIGQTEVTQGLWKAVMGTNPSSVHGVELPVANVSWNDCMTFISKLNTLTGRSFRLPTEAEWEFAARGGNKSKACVYAGGDDIDAVAWYYDNACYSYGRRVAQLRPNELGIYDMSGNNYEWCADFYGEYSSEPQVNPQGPASVTDRVIRSSSWYTPANECRNTSRVYGGPDEVAVHIGLRLAL